MHSYKPAKLTEWVSREISSNRNTSRLEKQIEIKELRIEILREILVRRMRGTLTDFETWIQSLSVRDLNSLIFLFEEIQTKEQKDVTVKYLFRLANSNRQLFKNCLDCFYHKEKTYPYWTLAKVAYSKNKDRLSKRWSDSELQDWNNFMQQKTSQEDYIVEKVFELKASIEMTCNKFRLNVSHPFYRSILIRMFEKADTAFLKKEKELFINLFFSLDIEGKQRLINAFVHAGALHIIEDISQLIYEKVSTYMRKPQLWNLVKPEYKVAFHSWAMLQNIREFFSGLNKNHERFVYWEKFVPKMMNAIVLKKEQTVLFYFEDVVIMEILGTGAVYIYEKQYFLGRWQERIEEFLEDEERKALIENHYSSVRLTRMSLMDKEKIVPGGWLIHSGEWQWKFDEFLSNHLNWEVDRDAILKQSKKQVTI